MRSLKAQLKEGKVERVRPQLAALLELTVPWTGLLCSRGVGGASRQSGLSIAGSGANWVEACIQVQAGG